MNVCQVFVGSQITGDKCDTGGQPQARDSGGADPPQHGAPEPYRLGKGCHRQCHDQKSECHGALSRNEGSTQQTWSHWRRDTGYTET